MHFPFLLLFLCLIWPTDRLINLGGGRGAARSTIELTLFLLGKGGGNPTGPVDPVGSGLGGVKLRGYLQGREYGVPGRWGGRPLRVARGFLRTIAWTSQSTRLP